jgi:hypothetical protein
MKSRLLMLPVGTRSFETQCEIVAALRITEIWAPSEFSEALHRSKNGVITA